MVRSDPLSLQAGTTLNMNNGIKTDTDPVKRPSAPSIFLENVSFAYPGEEIFRSFNFTVKGGQWTCLIGPSGCGKSTLLRLISGTLRGSLSGHIRFSHGNDHNRLTAWMAQKDLLLPWLTVLDNVCLGARLRGEMSVQKREKAISLLENAGLGEYSNSLPLELSGGMRKRVGLARAIALDPKIVLFDEPTTGLDPIMRESIDELIVSTQKRTKATFVIISHDIESTFMIAHKVAMLYQGKIVAVGTPDEIRLSDNSFVKRFIKDLKD